MNRRVVPLKPRHTVIRGDHMEEMKYGNTVIIFDTSLITPEESARAEYDLHMAAWAIVEELWEKGEAV